MSTRDANRVSQVHRGRPVFQAARVVRCGLLSVAAAALAGVMVTALMVSGGQPVGDVAAGDAVDAGTPMARFSSASTSLL